MSIVAIRKSFIFPAALFFGLFWSNFSEAQQDCRLRISLLTCSPGDELYATFGHSALRIIDSTANKDVVFNYGTFNFEESDFYMKFIRGKLRYFVSADDFRSFEYEYVVENRTITEQVLNLTCEEKEKIKDYLLWNMLPANMYYKYDFTFDNCTTRLGDIIDNITGDSLKFPSYAHRLTFRDAIHQYLTSGNKWWSMLGIDILLGRRLDRVMTPEQALFLPDNLMIAVDSAKIEQKPLVGDKDIALKSQYVPQHKNNVTGPAFLFTCLFVMIAFLSFSQNRIMKRILGSLDGLLFFINGIIGVILVFMWLGTDHFMTKDNLNLLWAWPVNLIAAFFVHSKQKWPKVYFVIFGISQILLLIFWFFLPQKMNVALIPLIGILIFRSFLYEPLNKRIHAKNKLQGSGNMVS